MGDDEQEGDTGASLLTQDVNDDLAKLQAENLALRAQLKQVTQKLVKSQVSIRFPSIEEGFSSFYRSLDTITDCGDLPSPPTRFRDSSLVRRYSDFSGINNIEILEATQIKGAPPPQIALERVFSCPL